MCIGSFVIYKNYLTPQFSSWQAAQDECCAYGAWAASFSSVEEMQCLALANQGMKFDGKIL